MGRCLKWFLNIFPGLDFPISITCCGQILDPVLCTPVGVAPITKQTIKAEQSRVFWDCISLYQSIPLKKKRYLHYDYRMSFFPSYKTSSYMACYGRKLYYSGLPVTKRQKSDHSDLRERGNLLAHGNLGFLGYWQIYVFKPYHQGSAFFFLCWFYLKGGLLLGVTRWLLAAPDEQSFLGGGKSASTCTWSMALELSVFGSDWSGLGHMPTLAAGEGVSSACFSWQRKEGIVSQGKSSVV